MCVCFGGGGGGGGGGCSKRVVSTCSDCQGIHSLFSIMAIGVIIVIDLYHGL